MSGCFSALTFVACSFCCHAMAWGPGCGRSLLRGKHSEQPGRGAALQRRAAATAEAVAIAEQKTRACRALLEVQEAAASALEAALKKCEEEISEIQAEVQQEAIFELERSACREDSHFCSRAMEDDVRDGAAVVCVSKIGGAALPTAAAGVSRFEAIRAQARLDIVASRILVQRIYAECKYEAVVTFGVELGSRTGVDRNSSGYPAGGCGFLSKDGEELEYEKEGPPFFAYRC